MNADVPDFVRRLEAPQPDPGEIVALLRLVAEVVDKPGKAPNPAVDSLKSVVKNCTTGLADAYGKDVQPIAIQLVVGGDLR